MKGMKKGGSLKILALALVIMLFVSCAGISVWAEDEQPTGDGTTGGDTTGSGTTGTDAVTFDVTGSKKADPVELEGDKRETEVTLKLPSGEYQNEVDIVFTMDSSSSAQNSAVFKQAVNDLFNSIISNNPNVILKIGVIRFRGRAHDAISYKSNKQYSGLVTYNDDTKGYIEAALEMTEAEIKEAFGNGSNPHGGLDIADEWLAADTQVDDDHKYVVFLTDGKGYIWNNDKNEPTTIYEQYYNNLAVNSGGSGRWTIQNGGIPVVNQSSGVYKGSYPVDVLDPSGNTNIFWFATYQDLYNSTSQELTGVSAWDAFCNYADNKNDVPTGSVVVHDEVTNGATLFGSKGDFQNYYEYIPDDAWKDVPYLKANPYEVTKNPDGTYTFDVNTINKDYYMYHVDGLLKGLYKAGHQWSDMNSKYNCAVITYAGGGATGFVDLRNTFISWLHTNSDYSADIKTSSQVETLFEEIDNSIRYMVSKGTVTDKIAPEFELVEADEPADTFKMTLNGVDLDVTYTDGKWNFGTATEGVYPYVVEFDGTDTITWTINVPVENLKPITLSYKLELKEASAEEGYYDTNASAVLDYKSTDGKKDGSYTFEVPVVHYHEYMDIIVIKGWVDEDNKDGRRPDSIVVNLYKDGQATGTSVKITSEPPEVPLDPEPVDPVPLDEPGNRGAKGPEQEPEDEPDEEPEVSEVWVGLIQNLERYVYEGFDPTKRDEPLVEIKYSVQEDKIPYYEAEYEGEAPFLVIVNTYVPPTPQPDTGYVSYRMLLIALQYLCVVLCAYAVVKQKRRLNRKQSDK